MKRVVRVLSIVMATAVSLTCADRATSNSGITIARIALAPSFATAPAGGPRISIERIRGVLRGATDSSMAEALVQGDSAILDFVGVPVHGDSSAYELAVRAFAASNELVFEGSQNLQIKPGDNLPATPVLEYVAADTSAISIDIGTSVSGALVGDTLTLDWAGADTASRSCLNRSHKAVRLTEAQLTISAVNSNSTSVPSVRVGWTSRDTSAFTVDSAGKVRAGCAGKTSRLVARTFTNKADSIFVRVNAAAFSLRMTPDSIDLPRGSQDTLTAEVIDEFGNVQAATGVTYHSSDTLRAVVNPATGVVTARSNGRVLITGSSNGRTTVGVVRVVRPPASSVVAQPAVALDSLAVGQIRTYFAKALDAAGRTIYEANTFTWSTTNPSVVTVNAATGVATAVAVGTAGLVVSLDGKSDTVSVEVLTALPPGTVKSRVKDAASGLPIVGVDVRSSPSNLTTSAADGSFTLTGLQGGDSVVLSKAGYVSAVAYSVPAFPNKTIEVPPISLSPTSGSLGTISGKVLNAVTGSVVSGIAVTGYLGINAGPTVRRPIVTPAFTTTSAADGSFSASNVPPGTYTIVYSGTGYSTTIGGGSSVGGVTKVLDDQLLPPAATAGALYVVLTWGDCAQPNVPCDLDAHLTGPLITPEVGRFQVFAGNVRYVSGPDTIAVLDVADNNSFGPEVLSLRPAAAVGMYKFYVHNKTAGTTPNRALADSASARVDVYQDNRLIGTFFPPSGVSGTVWNVFDYDGARLIPVGTVTSPADPNVLSLRAAPASAAPIKH